MSQKILIVNTGSASKKYAFYEDLNKLYTAHFEMEGDDLVVTENINRKDNEPTVNKKILAKEDYTRAADFIIAALIASKLIGAKEEINAIGIRIVAPSEYFLTTRIIDTKYLSLAEEALNKVPLHLGPALDEIKNLKKVFSENQAIIGVSDSAFHATMPEEARLYAVPIKDSRRFGLRRFGYHGISVQSVISRATAKLGKLPEKVIVCHLGGGASVTAVKGGQSLDSSMGFTPLEGLVMATRVGDIDAGAVLYLSEKLQKSQKELEDYFNNDCGLLGLSGKSSDLRELIESEKKGDSDSALALKIYVNRIKQYIGLMAAVLGGIELLIFAGTVGERSFIMRQRICNGLEFLGLELDKEINNQSEGIEVEISQVDSKAKILVLKTDEMLEIVKAVLALKN
jgi:acetate kinase